MSLARALTKRIKRHNDDGPSSPSKSGNSVRYAPGTINRNNISLPTELISTTNVQALTAPDIRKVSETLSSSSSTHSGHDSDFSTIDKSFLLNGESAPSTPLTPPTELEKDFFDTPSVPKRAPSHSKQAHEALSRKLSVQRMSPPPTSLNRPRSVRPDELSSSKMEESHPFGAELAQVKEVAEGFGAQSLLDEEEQFMQTHGLIKFGVEDYINEIQQLYGGVFEDQLGPVAKPWM